MSISGVNSSSSGFISNSNNAQSQALRTMLTSLQSQPTLFDVLSQDGAGQSGSSGDILDLSSQSQSAADQLYQLLQSASLGTTQTAVDKASASIQEKLHAALAQKGIDTSNEIDLQVDSNGNVVVANDNSQQQQIEDAINNDPELKKAVVEYLQFMQTMAPTLTGGSSSQSSSSSELQQLLASLGGGSQGTVTLGIQGNDFQTLYQDAGNNAFVLASSLG